MPECETHGSAASEQPPAATAIRARRGIVATACLLTTFLFLVPNRSEAIGGSVSVTDDRQTARLDSLLIETFSRRDVLSVGQRASLGPGLVLDAQFRSQREVSGTKASGVRLETERTTLQPSLRLSYDQPGFRIGTTGNWIDRRVTADVGTVPDQTQFQLGATMRADPTRGTRLSAIWRRSVTEQFGAATENRESREQSVLFDLDQRLFKSWNLGYRFSARSSNIVERDTRQLAEFHLVEISGSPVLWDGRLQTMWRARSRFSHQKSETGTAGESEILLVPISASLTLDDTPEVSDPLEDDPLSVPDLLDGNFDVPTVIDIGDLAPLVREFGGDYRNIAVDLGESQEIAGARLYVDDRLLLPELFVWQVFLSDDPDGREWTQVPPGEVSVTYQEFGGIRQGWEVAFLTSRESRRFKMVDVKLGETVPNLSVTELEIFRRERTVTSETTEDPRIHQADVTLGYQLTSRLRIGVQSSVRRRAFGSGAENLDEFNHRLSSEWRQGQLLLAGWYGRDRLWSERRADTDVLAYGLSARQGFGSDLTTTLSWTRTKDQSEARDRVTDDVSLHALWSPARRLRMTQRIARSTRTDELLGEESTSIVTSTTFRGSPIVSLTLDLVRTDRWADRPSGAGFERFNDTSLSTTWSPVPLVSLNSYIAYQERQGTEWVVRNSASWTPFPGGRAEPRFSGSTYSDTRTDNTRYSAEAAVRWRVHPRVIVDGSVATQRVELAGMTTTPVSTRVHLVWSF